jgi:hypothetical protein
MRLNPLIAALLFLSPAAVAADNEWRPLWNGKDFTGWNTWLGVPYPTTDVPGLAKKADGKYAGPIGLNRDPLKVFSVVQVDGRPAIRISGEINGTLTTKEPLADYHLRVQFKWGESRRPESKRDSAVFFHGYDLGQAGPSAWPRCLEFQVTEGDVGDLSTVTTKATVRGRPQGEAPAIYDPAGQTLTLLSQVPNKGRYNHCTKAADHERPHGQWNTLELYCVKDEAILVVNGGMVMRAQNIQRLDGKTWVPLTRGLISLQSKNGELFYRDVAVRTISAIPPAFAGK